MDSHVEGTKKITSNIFQSAMQAKVALLVIFIHKLSYCEGYGGWGPGEDYGHAGRNPPPNNWNAVYGYDQANILNNRYNYRQASFIPCTRVS